MGNGLVTPRGHYGAASVGALSATGDVGILLPLLDQRRSIGLVEAAGLIGVSSRTMRRYAAEGAVPGAFRVLVGSHWRFRRRELEAWWAKLQGATFDNRRFGRRRGVRQ